MSIVARKIATTTAMQIVIRIIEVFIGVVTLGIITRYLGQYGFGVYTTVNALLQFCIILVDFGLYLTLLREISANGDERTPSITNNVFTIRLISSVGILLLAITVISFTPYPWIVKIGVIVLAVSYLFASFIATLTALFQKHLQMVRIAILNLASKFILLGAVVFVVAANLGLTALFAASSITSIVTFSLVVWLLLRLPAPVRLGFAFDWLYWRSVIEKAWPIAVTTILNLIYFKADTIILSLYHSQETVGIYGASYRVLEILTTFPHMFMGLMMPFFTAAWVAGDMPRFTSLWQKTFSFFAIVTFPLIAGTMVVARPVMSLVAGAEFADAGAVLKVLIVATAAIFFGTLYTYQVIVVDRQRRIIKYFLAVAVLSLVGYLFFIPPFGYWGAAWMTVASEGAIIIGAWLTIRSACKLQIPWGLLARTAAASLCMLAATAFLSSFMPLIPLIIVSAVLYAGLILAFRAISLTELKNLLTTTEHAS